MTVADSARVPARHTLLLLLLWAAVTALNFAKPFHLDDTAHLLIAEQIVADPLHPMSGMLNWLDTAEPIAVTNQPHLFFYLMAAVMALFGPSEAALHGLEALFALAAIIGIHRLALKYAHRSALFVTATIVLAPAFIINQNVMVDIPLLAFLVWAVVLVTQARPGSAGWGFAAYSAALLTKYTALFLYPAMIWAAAGNWRRLLWAVLPIAALTGWSLFNIADYGQAHILNRPANEGGLIPSPKLSIALFSATGAFALPVAVFLSLSVRTGLRWLALWAVATLVFGVAARMAEPAQGLGWIAANAVLVGAVAPVALAAAFRIGAMIWPLLSGSQAFRPWYREHRGGGTLAAWLIGGTLFLVTFPPFMATRHALLIAPPLLILALAGRNWTAGHKPQVLTLGAWALFSAFVFFNDLQFARFYQEMAPRAATMAARHAEPDARIFQRGHWGWQWYAAAQGMAEFDSERTHLQPGDILVDPVGISAQRLDDPARFEVIVTLTETPSLATVIDTHRLYASGALALPLLAPNEGRVIRILKRKE